METKSLTHWQFKMVEKITSCHNQGGDHFVFCQDCNESERVSGISNVVAFINRHRGHKTWMRTFMDVN